MSLVVEEPIYGPRIRWRTLEWVGAWVALFLLSGAIFPFLLMGPEVGELTDSARSKLRLLGLPVYLIAAGLLARQPSQLVVAVRRNLPMLALLALPFMSILWSIGPSVTLRRAIGLLGSMLLSYLLAIRFTPSQLMLLVVAVLGPMMILSILAMGAMPGRSFMLDGAAMGIFVHKNVLGWAAALCTVIAGIMVVDRTLGMQRIGLLVLPASLVCLVASTSMTGLLSVTAAAGLTAFYRALARQRRRINRFVMILLLLQFVAVLLTLLSLYLGPALEALGKDATLTGRVPLWALVDEMIARQPVLGYGYQAFWSEGNGDAWRIWAIIGWMAPHSHNGYRETLLGLGIVGLLVLFVVVARACWQGAVLHCNHPEDGWLWPNVLIGMFLVMNLTEAIFLLQNDLFFTLFAAAVLSISLRYPERAGGSRLEFGHG